MTLIDRFIINISYLETCLYRGLQSIYRRSQYLDINLISENEKDG